ncbi:MAG: reactive intermediate/imine deaminase [Chloroflexota bacterium]|nr:MAG: reactive intermediate/imine deaminase [Chloroflexota bacterium]
MRPHFEPIHTAENDPKWNMPYAPAVKVHSGKTIYVAGVTAAPVYHSHPHIPAEFDHIPEEAGRQTEMALENLRNVLRAAGGDLDDVVQLFRFMVDQEKNQDAINRVMARYFGEHRPTTTSVEVVRLATDPRLVLEITAVAVVAE